MKSFFLNSTNDLTIFSLKDFDFNLTTSLAESFFVRTDAASQNNE